MLEASRNGECAVLAPKKSRNPAKQNASPAKEERIPIPPTISHFVMNLPASAIEFLPSYRGLYAGHETLFAPHTATKLPLVHVHCFSVKADDETPIRDICERISKELAFGFQPAADGAGEDAVDTEGVVKVHRVRDVAPAKSMYCATFRLPASVAFAARE